ncbi:MAG: TetR/AcrR family transcriptional regulator [Cyanobacteria bacterium P01_D01_bin.71]
MPKIVDRDRYRRELLAQCLSLFAEKGFSVVTMRQIASSLGVSTGTLYHYFPNKETIFAQLVEEYCGKDVAEFFSQAPVQATLKEKLQNIMAYFLKKYAAYQQQFLIWVDFYQYCRQENRPDVAVLQQSWQRTQRELVTYLQLPPVQIDCLLAFLDGLLLQCLYGRTEAEIAQQVEVFTKLFVSSTEQEESR